MAKRSTEKKWEKSQDKRIAAAEKRAEAAKTELDTLEKMERLNLRMTKDQKEKLKSIREEKKLQEGLKTLSDSKASTLTKIAKLERENVGFQKNAFGMGTRVLKVAKGNLEVIEAAAEKGNINVDLANNLQSITEGIVDENTTLEDLKSKELQLQQMLIDGEGELNEEEKQHIENTLKLNKQELKRRHIQKEINEGLAQGDELIGGIGASMKKFMLNPLTAGIALLLAFNAQQEAIADEFGAIGVTEFRGELAGASQEFTKIGLDGKEALTTTKALSKEFGISFEKATALADTVGNLAKSTGMTTDESAKLVGLFTEIGGLSEQGAEQLAKQAESLAVANGIAPNVVLKDIAGSSEQFAKFSGAGAEGIARAAIQARKLGLELSDVTGAMEVMLDFQSSLNSEVEASVLLGRNVNLQKARELSLAGDIEGFQKEILNQVGSQAEFDKMNVLQKKALATATGLTVEQLSKMVSKEKEAVTLSGQLNKQSIDKIVPEEAITNVANLIGQFQVLGMQLAESFGPIVNMILSAFVGLANAMEKTVGLGPGLVGMYTALTIAKKKDTAVTIANAVAKFFGAASSYSAATMGFGTLVGVAIAAGAVATMLAAVASVAVGDFDMKAGGKPTFTTGEGERFSFSKNDDVLAAPGLSAAVNGMGGGTVVNNVDTSKMEKATAKVESKLDEVITVLVDQPKKFGKKVTQGFDGVVNS